MSGLEERLREKAATLQVKLMVVVDAWDRHVAATEQLNAMRPKLEATPIERDRYEQCYQAKSTIEREMWAASLRFAEWCSELRADNIVAPLLAAHTEAADEIARLREALEGIDTFVRTYFEPWGSWKTPWWEGEVSDEAAFSDGNALKHVANLAKAALASGNGESTTSN